MIANNGRYRMTREEREFEEFSRHYDVELFCLEIMYSEALEKGVREALDRKQAEFEQWLETHPDTIAERARWQENREKMARRMARLKPVSQTIPAERAAKQLARRWGLSRVG